MIYIHIVLSKIKQESTFVPLPFNARFNNSVYLRTLTTEALSNTSRAKMNKLLKALLVVLIIDNVCAVYVIDDSVGLGRMFNGIGGLSGGGVSPIIIKFFLPHILVARIIHSLLQCSASAYMFICM